ncbi:N-acetylmuramoyl-L-alanine amidase, partial [Escherichia coli]|nr:N-acetylmuramoyl-L-alanine amidase [Escherichia coli]
QFADAIKNQNAPTASTQVGPKGDRVASAAPMEVSKAPKPFTVVVDAGHGGIDSGAESTGGIMEKDVTLMFARELRDQLTKIPGLRIEMTRDSDEFLRLPERVRIARQYEADL